MEPETFMYTSFVFNTRLKIEQCIMGHNFHVGVYPLRPCIFCIFKVVKLVLVVFTDYRSAIITGNKTRFSLYTVGLTIIKKLLISFSVNYFGICIIEVKGEDHFVSPAS